MIFLQPAGQTNSKARDGTRKGVLAAPDYKAMYLELFRASEQAARLLQEAQARAEQQLLAADPPPIELAEKKES
ncbi:hypothetical protein [Faecalibacterium sp. Marseille-P9312]|nr:hypothetical protein [Faecalibacterium sp. Marseille-P9312]